MSVGHESRKGTKYPEIWAALAAPFEPSEVKSRNQGGRKLSYISARTAMNRLDEELGGENWRPVYTETTRGIKCRIEYRLPDGEWNFKEDGGGFAGMPEADNDEKSGYSDSLKRAAAAMGVGRYLYQDGVPHYGEQEEPPAQHRPAPQRGPAPREGGRRQQESNARRQEAEDRPPTSGRALFAWIKKQEEQHGPGLLKLVDDWGKGNRLPYKMVDWPETAVAMAHEAALHMLPTDGVTPDEQRHYEEALAN